MDPKHNPSHKPPTLSVIPENVPETLRRLPQWLGWAWKWRPDKDEAGTGVWTKPPIDLNTGGYGKSTKAETWCDFETAVRVLRDKNRGWELDGIGFALLTENRIVGVDWDKVFDAETGEILSDAEDNARILDTYTEVSPSGSGLRSFAITEFSPTEKREGDVEMYNQGRYLTVTGHKRDWAPSDIMERPQEITAYFNEVFKERIARKEAKRQTGGVSVIPADLSDREVLAMARKAKNGNDFARLYDLGDLSTYGDNHSSADLALCNILAFWCGGDEMQIDRIFRTSALYRDKWDRPDYRTRTIECALIGRTEFFSRRVKQERTSPQGSRNGHSTAVAKTRVAELSCAVREITETEPAGDLVPSIPIMSMRDPELYGNLPEIEIKDRQLRDITDDALKSVILANNPPSIFVSTNRLSRLEIDEDSRYLHPVALTVDSMIGVLARSANWFKDVATDVAPPQGVARDILSLGKWTGVPVLRGIVTSPVLSPDLEIVNNPGYDWRSGLYYDSRCERVPDEPLTSQSYEDARSLIFDDMLGDFPFKDEASKANAVALMLLPILRPAITGPCPMTVIDAPTPGTGKSLLAEIILLLFSPGGVPNRSCPPVDDDAEWKKSITSAILARSQFFFLDNVKGALTNQSLQSAITSTMWTDRVLGSKDQIEMRNTMIFVATANNIPMDKEISRRIVWIRLDANQEHPENRTGFRHDPIRDWVIERRPRILAALVMLIRAWIDGGRKPSVRPVPQMGSFESYVKLVSSIMDYAMPGFLLNREVQQAKVTDAGPWHAFTEAWWNRYQGNKVCAFDLLELGKYFFAEQLGDKGEASQKARLAKLLTRNTDRVFDGRKIESLGIGKSVTEIVGVTLFRVSMAE